MNKLTLMIPLLVALATGCAKPQPKVDDIQRDLGTRTPPGSELKVTQVTATDDPEGFIRVDFTAEVTCKDNLYTTESLRQRISTEEWVKLQAAGDKVNALPDVYRERFQSIRIPEPKVLVLRTAKGTAKEVTGTYAAVRLDKGFKLQIGPVSGDFSFPGETRSALAEAVEPGEPEAQAIAGMRTKLNAALAAADEAVAAHEKHRQEQVAKARAEFISQFTKRTAISGGRGAAASWKLAADGQLSGTISWHTRGLTRRVSGRLDGNLLTMDETSVEENVENQEVPGRVSYSFDFNQLSGTQLIGVCTMNGRTSSIAFDMATARDDSETERQEIWRADTLQSLNQKLVKGISLQGYLIGTHLGGRRLSVRLAVQCDASGSVRGLIEWPDLGVERVLSGQRSGPDKLTLSFQQVGKRPGLPYIMLEQNEPLLIEGKGQLEFSLGQRRPEDKFRLGGNARFESATQIWATDWTGELDPASTKELSALPPIVAWASKAPAELEKNLSKARIWRGTLAWFLHNELQRFPLVFKLEPANGSSVTGIVEWPTLKVSKKLSGSIEGSTVRLMETGMHEGDEFGVAIGIEYVMSLDVEGSLRGDINHFLGKGWLIIK
ncbi:MAG TPA: hypothetical protein VGH19_18640 [Verrucomicrobiae bacterium]